ncbi:MAG TPA: carboxypeptidase-like regulatory domain-containing protein [Nitrososphaera sp.]|nr:carboxypeptidase-like regulatory domain-containing protein [Nitrososphaera sp.]
MTTELIDIKGQFEELQKKYREHMPKVDPALVDDLMLRQMENPDVVPMYLLEVFTKEGLDTEQVRSYIISKTGMSPAIYDNGTHYVTNQKLTLDILKEISDSEDVIEVTGEYTGGLGSYGASHEHNHRIHEEQEIRATSKRPQDATPTTLPTGKGTGYRMAIYTAIGIVGAIALAGFIISGGMTPNANSASSLVGTEPGLVHGYVAGPTGLPAIGATVLAVQQGTDFSASAFVSVSGQYTLSLPPGEYIVVVAFPDGTDRVLSAFEVGRGASYELNINY